MSKGYPLAGQDLRRYPPDFSGRVFVWDVDKTYLDTHFSSLHGLLRIPLEFAVDKRSLPGMPEVLRGLRRGPGPDFAAAPIYFVTASPPQLRAVLERKMLLDGVEYDGIFFKDWLRALAGLRPGRLREQIGFKLCALLSARLARPRSVEVLFGDDTESDPQAFSLYARLLQGMSAGDAESAMQQLGVSGDDRRCVRELLDRLGGAAGAVEKIFVYLARGTLADEVRRLGPLLLPVNDAYQLAWAAHRLGYVDRQALEAARCACERQIPGFDAARSQAAVESRL
jgi:hypothetical protein